MATKPEVVQKRPKQQNVTYEPELVVVRATRRGQYGYREVVEAKVRDDRGIVRTKKEIGRDAKIYNPGETFEMDVNDMRRWPLSEYGNWKSDDQPVIDGERRVGTPKERPHIGQEAGPEIIKIGDRQFELPSWVTLAEGEPETPAVGHTKEFGNRST